ncbi:MAG: cyclic nucleotide-binding domain-containing protein [Methylococcales bacterium]|jgi:eukaryotic-like serine/threonine-protein kinase|nr:cyclic nucleotide-binding domain-containing protein [Methylococcales bacterium]MBT7445408.1 cyclic nucleotide-binding domain-containing protein [Methylococcales bacterium]
MKLVEGDTLTDYIKKMGDDRLENLDKILEVFLKVLDATSFAHNRGIIHRDLKPSNIMIGNFGEVYLMDWGIVKRYRENHDGDIQLPPELAELQQYDQGIIGTPAYMSPEQANGLTDQLQPCSDIFSLGGILFYCLTGQSPYPPEDTLIRAKMGKRRPINEAHYIPDGILDITEKAMSFNPDERFESVLQMHAAVEDFLHGKHLPIIHFLAGDTITKTGENKQTAYFIHEGTCVAYEEDKEGNRTLIKHLGAGDVFGELSLLSNRSRTTTVEALADTSVLEINPDNLSQDLGLNDWFGALFSQVVERYLALETRL